MGQFQVLWTQRKWNVESKKKNGKTWTVPAKIESISRNKHWIWLFSLFNCMNRNNISNCCHKKNNLWISWKWKYGFSSSFSSIIFRKNNKVLLDMFIYLKCWADISMCVPKYTHTKILRNRFLCETFFSGTCIDWCWCGQWLKIDEFNISNASVVYKLRTK